MEIGSSLLFIKIYIHDFIELYLIAYIKKSNDECGCSYTTKFFNATSCRTLKENKCLYELNEKLKDNHTKTFSKECPLECNSYFYEISHSSKKFPTTSYAKYLMKHHEIFNQSFDLNRTLTVEDVSENIAKIRIYSYDTKYMVVEEMAAISLIELVSDIGGLLGLFMGMSLLSFFELFELVIMIFSELCGKKRICWFRFTK